MIAKEWRDARWKFVLAAVAFLALVAIMPRTFDRIQADVEREIRWTIQEIQSPDTANGPGGIPPGEQRRFENQMREELRRIEGPGYPVEYAREEVAYLQGTGNFAILLPLAGLLGVALVSGEVSRGSIILLLSKPMSRGRLLLTKYAVGATCLLAAALLGGVGMLVSAYAHGYPSGAVDLGRIAGSAVLFWLGSLFVLGTALLASVVFRYVIRTLIATVVTLYLVFSIPEILRIPLELFFWSDSYKQNWRLVESWYEYFQIFRLYDYWSLGGYYLGREQDPLVSVAVCLVTAAVPLLVALWLFRRKAY